MSKWDVVYERAVRRDGSLFFPERLTADFLEQARRTQGSYIYANQYMNLVIPDDDKVFRKEWLKYYSTIPELVYTFAFIDPAISQSENADFTALVVVDVDVNQNWYVKVANRYKYTPTQIVDMIFSVSEEFKPQAIGVESVAFQQALIYMVNQEMHKRGKIVPVSGINPGTERSKEMRILGLVPRFEWNRIFLNRGLHDLEIEYAQFPRGSHDDLLDALASLEQIVYYPTIKRGGHNEPTPNQPGYESHYIKQLIKRSNGEGEEEY